MFVLLFVKYEMKTIIITFKFSSNMSFAIFGIAVIYSNYWV